MIEVRIPSSLRLFPIGSVNVTWNGPSYVVYDHFEEENGPQGEVWLEIENPNSNKTWWIEE